MLAAGRSAVTCKRTRPPLAWRSSHPPSTAASLSVRTMWGATLSTLKNRAETAAARPIRKPRVAKRGNCRLPRCPPKGILTACRPRRSQQALRASGTSLGPSGQKSAADGASEYRMSSISRALVLPASATARRSESSGATRTSGRC